MKFPILLSLAAALPLVSAIAFEGPAPTGIDADRALVDTSPKPTTAPSVNELKKRQSRASPATCGWVDGEFASPIACSVGRTCMLYKSASLGMAGCCGGSDTQNCGWASACVNYQNYVGGNCGTNCILNTLIRKCTNIASPYCVTWTYPSDGVADYGCDDTSTNTVYTIRQTAKDTAGGTTSTRLPTAAAGAVIVPSGISTNTTNRKAAKKLAIGAIIGIVVAVLFIIFFVAIGVFMFMKKKKKQKQIAANAQIVADIQANGPQTQYQQPPLPQQMQHQAPTQNQTPQPNGNGYFAPPNQQAGEQKYNPHTSVHEYAMAPISNPATPAPAYAQPYGSPAPPMPQQNTAQYQPPANGAHEIPSPMTPQQHAGQYQPSASSAPSPMQQQQYTGQYQPPANGAREIASPQHTGHYQPPADGAHEVASPVVQQHAGHYQAPAGGAHEVASPPQQYQGQNAGAHGVDAPGKMGPGPVYEMGGR